VPIQKSSNRRPSLEGEQTYRFHSEAIVGELDGEWNWEMEWLGLDPPDLPPIRERVSKDRRDELKEASLLDPTRWLSGTSIRQALSGVLGRA
jgi:hypothetical protein